MEQGFLKTYGMKKTKLILRTLLLLFVTHCFLFTTHAQVWDAPRQAESKIGGTGGYIGQFSKMLVVNGNPAVACYDGTRQDLMYVRSNDSTGSSWGDPVTIDAYGDVGEYLSFCIVNGYPAIAYYDATNDDLKYVRASDVNGSTWGTPVSIDVNGIVGLYTSMAIVNGRPGISYIGTNGDLKYVRAADADGTTWNSPITVDSVGSSAGHTSICVINGNPAISFVSGDLKYVRALDANGNSWGASVAVDTTVWAGWFSSLAVVNGNPAISYYNGDLLYVRAADSNGNSWGIPDTLDAPGDVGYYSNLAIVNGNPAISYYSGTLRYIRASDANGSTWGTPVAVDASGDLGLYTSLVIIQGYPAIAYHSRTGGDLKYVRASHVSGLGWGVPVTIDAKGATGQYSSLATVSGKPAMSYYDPGYRDLKYVRAVDSGGTAWGTPVTIDATGNVGQYTSLAMVNGNPAIAYYDATNGDLRYVRASDTIGSSWGTPVVVDSRGTAGQYISLTVVNGNPAISYYDAYWTELRYVRATDANGSSWGVQMTIDDNVTVGQFTSLAVVNGNPAISYYNATYGDLKYVRASDTNGSSWNTPLTIDATGTVGAFTSLAVVNGKPAISYYNTTYGDLKYVHATDTNGSSWGTPLTIDTTGDVGQFTNLRIVNGSPAISYYDATYGDLKYIRASDASGSAWRMPVVPDTTVAASSTSMVFDGLDVFIAYFDGDVLPGLVHGTLNEWTGGASSTNWFATGNWSMGIVPASPDNIGIPAGLSFYPDISSGTANCKNITVATGAKLIISGGTLEVGGAISNFDTINATGGTMVLSGSVAQPINAGTLNISNLVLDNSAGATIESGTVNLLDTYTPTKGMLTTGRKLVLKSNATTTARIAGGDSTGGYIKGYITVERYIPGKRCFRFFGHPFISSLPLFEFTDDIDITGSGGANNGFTTTGTNDPSAFFWDVNTANNTPAINNPGWQDFSSANTISWDRYELLRLLVYGEKGQGLTGGSYTPNATTFEASGEVNQGTQAITLTKGPSSNFVTCGNPFPSGIEMSTVTLGGNVGANYYVWDATSGTAGAYVTNAWSLPYVLPPFGAFLTTISANDNITIEEVDKAPGGAALFKTTAPKNWVELLISDSTIKWDRLLINLDYNAMDVEDKLDGRKLYNPGLNFFTLSKDDVLLAVDVRPYNDGASIPLGLAAYNMYNKYVIKTGMFDIPSGTKLFLHDKYLNKKEELNPGFEYWFDITADTNSQGNNRFEINMVDQPANSIAFTERRAAKMQIIPNPAKEEVKISFDKLEGKAILKLSNIAGQVIFSSEIEATVGSVIIPLHNLSAGIYIVELQSSNAKFSEKLIKE